MIANPKVGKKVFVVTIQHGEVDYIHGTIEKVLKTSMINLVSCENGVSFRARKSELYATKNGVMSVVRKVYAKRIKEFTKAQNDEMKKILKEIAFSS